MMDDWRVANLITVKTSSAWMIILGLAFGWLVLSTTAAETIHRVGVLALGSATGNAADLDALRNRLNDLGYAEGRNLMVEGRYADGNAGRLPALASGLARLNVDAIVTITTPAAQAAKNATDRIPIVMAGSAAPVELGLINSLAHPGGNVTGLTNSPGADFPAKQLQLLKEAVPKSSRVAVLMTSNSVEALAFSAMQDAAPASRSFDSPLRVPLRSICVASLRRMPMRFTCFQTRLMALTSTPSSHTRRRNDCQRFSASERRSKREA